MSLQIEKHERHDGKDLKVGDTVNLYSSPTGGPPNISRVRIERITPSGQIALEGGYRMAPNKHYGGFYEPGHRFSGREIITDEAVRRLMPLIIDEVAKVRAMRVCAALHDIDRKLGGGPYRHLPSVEVATEYVAKIEAALDGAKLLLKLAQVNEEARRIAREKSEKEDAD